MNFCPHIKIFFFSVFILLAGFVAAQIRSVKIGIDGLTCSACTRTVEISVRKLTFVKDVEMNLENTDGTITFKDTATVDMGKIAKAVTDAGFSVRFLTVTFHFDNLPVHNNYCYAAGSYIMEFVNVNDKTLDGEVKLKLLGKEFQPRSDFNKSKNLLNNPCEDKSHRTYFVTL